MKPRSHPISVAAVLLLIALLSVGCAGPSLARLGQRAAVVQVEPGLSEQRLLAFDSPLDLDALPSGWHHVTFRGRAPNQFWTETTDGIPALRCTTDQSGSMLVRHVDVPLSDFPVLQWKWKVSKGIDSTVDEDSPAGDDSAARIMLVVVTSDGEDLWMELVWAHQLSKGEQKFVHGFPHPIVRGAGDSLGEWFQESVDVSQLCSKFFPGRSGFRLYALGFFCDSDDTGSETSSSFSDIRVSTR